MDEFIDNNEARSLVAQNIPAAMTAQKVGVKRDLPRIMADIKTMAAMAGSAWVYRFPVKNKDGSTAYIEGPTIRCAQNVARIYGNCTTGCRVIDDGMFLSFEAFFVDLETGFNLMRPFRQRKSMSTMKTSADRQAEIVMGVGASKATRNVIVNALEHFVNFATEEAKQNLVDKIGSSIEKYRAKVAERLTEMNIDSVRVERLVGRPCEKWLAQDIARIITEIQAVQDGMASAEDIWPLEVAVAGSAATASTSPVATETGLDQFNQPVPQERTRRARSATKAEPAPVPPVEAEAAPVADKPAFYLVDMNGQEWQYDTKEEFPAAALELMEQAFKQGGAPTLDSFMATNKATFDSMPSAMTDNVHAAAKLWTVPEGKLV